MDKKKFDKWSDIDPIITPITIKDSDLTYKDYAEYHRKIMEKLFKSMALPPHLMIDNSRVNR